MTAGVGIVGRDITLTAGGVTLAGVVEKSLTLTNETLETTDDQSSGWQEFLAKAGKKGIALSVSGTFKNAELFDTWFQTSNMVACVVTIPDGATTDSTLSFDAMIESIEQGAPANELSTFSASMQSSGQPTWVAGT